jgi:FKBP-type peptidyl-prolyl cis-trans isomerase
LKKNFRSLVALTSMAFTLKAKSLKAFEQLEVLKLAPFKSLEFTTLEPGLQVADISAGKGPRPLPGDICVVVSTKYILPG